MLHPATGNKRLDFGGDYCDSLLGGRLIVARIKQFHWPESLSSC